MGTDALKPNNSLMENGLYRCHQCGGDFELKDFDTSDHCCYECLDSDDYADNDDIDDDYEDDYEDDYL